MKESDSRVCLSIDRQKVLGDPHCDICWSDTANVQQLPLD